MMVSFNRTNWADLLRAYRQRTGLSKTALARALSLTIGYISKLESGQKPPPEGQRLALCRVLELSEEEAEGFHIQAELERADPTSVKYLLRLAELGQHGDSEPVQSAEPADSSESECLLHVIPIINKVAAGYPEEFTDLDYPAGVADDYFSVPDVTDPNAFAFYVHGDSMEPEFPEKSLMIASPNTVPFDGDPCFVRFSAVSKVSGCTFKRAYFASDGQIRLVPINRRHPEQIYNRDDISGLWPTIRQYRHVPRLEAKPGARRGRKSRGRASWPEGNQASPAAG